jgi:hypothetical protein
VGNGGDTHPGINASLACFNASKLPPSPGCSSACSIPDGFKISSSVKLRRVNQGTRGKLVKEFSELYAFIFAEMPAVIAPNVHLFRKN